MDAVEIDDGVNRIQQPGLLSFHFIAYGIGNSRNQARPQLGTIHLFQMRLDLPHRHAVSAA